MKFNMKKIMGLLCALVMVLALAGCGGDNGGGQQQANTNNGPSAYELYTQANEAINGLESVEYNIGIGMSMDVSGEKYDLTMDGNMKQVKTGAADTDFDLAFNMNMDMSQLGAGSLDMNMYYTNGYLYYDMGPIGQMKVAMDLATAEAQMQGSSGMADIDEKWIKDSAVDGNKIHLVVDGGQMTDYVANYAGSVAQNLEGGEVTMGDVVIDLTTDAAGMPVSYKMVMPMTVTAEGETMTMDLNMIMDVVATENITIDFPADMDSWVEIDASQLG